MTTPPVPQSDYSNDRAAYDSIVAQMARLQWRPEFPNRATHAKYAELWAEIEALKNKYGGSIPPNPEDQAR